MPTPLAKPKHERGYTIVELSVVIAIVAVLLGIVLALCRPLLNSTQVDQEQKNITKVITGIQRTYFNRSNFSTLTESDVIGMNIVSQDLVSANVIVNRWGGQSHIAPLVAGLHAPFDEVSYTSTQVPSSVCVELVQSLTNVVRSIRVGVSGAQVTVKQDGVPLDLQLTGSSCAASEKVDISFIFGK